MIIIGYLFIGLEGLIYIYRDKEIYL